MKKEGRTTLVCRKDLRNGIVDYFTVVVKSDERDAAKKRYEDAGYKVSFKK